MEHDWTYYVAYWFTAFLPVILGFGITVAILYYLQKHYNGPEDEEENQNTSH